MKSLFSDLKLLHRIIGRRDAQWRARFVAACAVGDLFSPIQLIWTFIPLIGQLDDPMVLYAGMKFRRQDVTAIGPGGRAEPYRGQSSGT